jgi:hypothetical protein
MIEHAFELLLTLFIAILGRLMLIAKDSHKALEAKTAAETSVLREKIHSVEVMVAMQCIRREEFSSAIEKLEENLQHNFDKVFDKLDRKADKL